MRDDDTGGRERADGDGNSGRRERGPDEPTQQWDAVAYDDRHSFVADYGRDLLDLLDPGPGDRVLDLGCGTGRLTAAIADRGADVVGVDASAEMIGRAREAHPDLAAEGRFVVADAREYVPGLPGEQPDVPRGQFDAVFSNAMLHWVPEADQDAVLATVRDALRPGGRLVAELGGRGNVASIVDAVGAAVAALGSEPATPWYFPSVGDYASRLEANGLEVRRAALFDRPTDLDGGEAGLREWLDGFGDRLLAPVPADERGAVVAAAEDRLRPALFDGAAGSWVADYRRLRVVAVREGGPDE
jgi:SAM-dependent methyltransferase